MPYSNLQELIGGSRSSRAFFLSLPIRMQLALHEQSDGIRTAEQLRRTVERLQGRERALHEGERGLFG